jgi:toxin ParE1/3/4
MAGYRFAQSAEEDLADIVQFTLRTWGADQASSYVDGLEQLAASVAENPRIGKPCEDLAPGLRAFPYESHALYYLTGDDVITIIRVLHQSMNAASRFGEE